MPELSEPQILLAGVKNINTPTHQNAKTTPFIKSRNRENKNDSPISYFPIDPEVIMSDERFREEMLQNLTLK